MLPRSPYLLLSLVNTKLRDQYSSLQELCDDLEENLEEIVEILAAINYHYDATLNQFK